MHTGQVNIVFGDVQNLSNLELILCALNVLLSVCFVDLENGISKMLPNHTTNWEWWTNFVINFLKHAKKELLFKCINVSFGFLMVLFFMLSWKPKEKWKNKIMYA